MRSRLLVVALVLGGAQARAAEGAPSDGSPCDGTGTSIVVVTDEHRLWLCEDGAPIQSFNVSLGTGGVGKHAVGDLRTPLGNYPLGQPHRSTKYYFSIPVGYPTPAQRKQGFTGKDIAIHGPLRRHRKANGPQTKLDWTRGCIAVGTDAAIALIARWVTDKQPKQVHIQ